MENFALITLQYQVHSSGVAVSVHLCLIAAHDAKMIDFGIFMKLSKVTFSSLLD